MKIALVGASGHIGRQIAATALQRGHRVTAITRRDSGLPAELDGAHVAIAPVDDADALAAAIAGQTVLASAYGAYASPGSPSVDQVSATLIEAARKAGIRRVIVVGGAGTLEVAPGLQLVDTPEFPAVYKPTALDMREASKRFIAADDLDWTFFAPAAEIGPGEKRGGFRTQAKDFLADAEGHSRISHADYADAFVDEIERPQYLRQVATAAY